MINTICAVSLDSAGEPGYLLKKMIHIQSGEIPDETMLHVDDSGRFGIASSGNAYGSSFYHDAANRIAVAFSGSLINARKLEDGLAPCSGSAELISRLFLQSGSQFVNRLYGSFNIAIFDGKNDRILVFRDHSGFLPLFYSTGKNGIVAAASRIEALTGSGIASSLLDFEAISYFLYDKAFPASETPFIDVRGVRPGHCITLSSSTIDIEQYYKLPIQKKKMDEKEAIDTAESILLEVLEENIGQSDEIGMLLSGGVDSTLILCMVRSITDRPVHTYSIFLDPEGTDERFIQKVSAHFGTIHHEIVLNEDTFRKSLIPLVKSYPTPAVGAWHIYLGTLAAGKDGVTSVMSGFGGEVVFGIPDTYIKMDKIHRFLRFLDSGRPFDSYLLEMISRGAGALSRLFPRAGIISQYSEFRQGRQRWLGSKLDGKVIDEFLAVETSNFRKVHEKYLDDYAESGTSDLTDMLLYSRMINFEGNKILGKCDELARRNGVELFHPFMDRRMVEFGFSVPTHLKHRSGQYRHLEISLAGRYHIFEREKSAFIAPFEQWLRSDTPGEARLSFDASDISERGIFKTEELIALWEEFLKEESDFAWSDIFSIISLEVWLRNILSFS